MSKLYQASKDGKTFFLGEDKDQVAGAADAVASPIFESVGDAIIGLLRFGIRVIFLVPRLILGVRNDNNE